ncbi:MAG TPA: hypothetical protein VJQ58_12550 [Burkholderiales bacterium]|nr:hypothetical protein [Burkholderiales bacterium]
MSTVAFVQGVYYLVSGAWALLHIESFMRVTGPKHDVWLVKTVGGLLVAIGAALLLAGWSAQLGAPLVVIAMGSAATLLVIELVYMTKRVISRIYLADAAIEMVLIAWWAAVV